MYYAGFGILSLILHIIINHDVLRNRNSDETPLYKIRYREFLLCILVYYVTDIMWGLFNELRIVPLAYIDTLMYFLSLALSVFLWVRYVVEYIGRKGRRSNSLIYGGCAIFAFTVLHLIINVFNPVIFDFNSVDGYVPGSARYIIFIVLFLLQMTLAVYSLIVSSHSEGTDKIRYMTVSSSGAVTAVFIILQTKYPFLPFYAIGTLVSTCLIHVFVEEDERLEMRLKLRTIEEEAEKEHMKTRKAENTLRENQKQTITFGQIAESLASNYDVIYYVDINDGSYIGYSSRNIYGQLKIDRSGDDFFGDVRRNIPQIVHPQDNERITSFMDKDYLLSTLENRKQAVAEYRLIVNDRSQHTRIVIRKSSDSGHFIIGVENIEAEVRKEKEHLKALNTEKELARRDELTGIRNKTAYAELAQSVQQNIDNGMDYLPFAIAVCDVNDLKKINDTEGHKAGDEYIVSAAKMLCDIFDHSPVFRIGGDEFVVFLRGVDYSTREELMVRLHEEVMANVLNENGPIIAAGISDFSPENDTSVSDVFERADNKMYEDKRQLKLHSS